MVEIPHWNVQMRSSARPKLLLSRKRLPSDRVLSNLPGVVVQANHSESTEVQVEAKASFRVYFEKEEDIAQFESSGKNYSLDRKRETAVRKREESRYKCKGSRSPRQEGELNRVPKPFQSNKIRQKHKGKGFPEVVRNDSFLRRVVTYEDASCNGIPIPNQANRRIASNKQTYSRERTS